MWWEVATVVLKEWPPQFSERWQLELSTETKPSAFLMTETSDLKITIWKFLHFKDLCKPRVLFPLFVHPFWASELSWPEWADGCCTWQRRPEMTCHGLLHRALQPGPGAKAYSRVHHQVGLALQQWTCQHTHPDSQDQYSVLEKMLECWKGALLLAFGDIASRLFHRWTQCMKQALVRICQLDWWKHSTRNALLPEGLLSHTESIQRIWWTSIANVVAPDSREVWAKVQRPCNG